MGKSLAADIIWSYFCGRIITQLTSFLVLFLFLTYYAKSGPVTKSVYVSNQDLDKDQKSGHGEIQGNSLSLVLIYDLRPDQTNICMTVSVCV